MLAKQRLPLLTSPLGIILGALRALSTPARISANDFFSLETATNAPFCIGDDVLEAATLAGEEPAGDRRSEAHDLVRVGCGDFGVEGCVGAAVGTAGVDGRAAGAMTTSAGILRIVAGAEATGASAGIGAGAGIGIGTTGTTTEVMGIGGRDGRGTVIVLGGAGIGEGSGARAGIDGSGVETTGGGLGPVNNGCAGGIGSDRSPAQ